MKKVIALSALLALGALGFGCGGTTTANNTANGTNATNTNAARTTNANANTAPANTTAANSNTTASTDATKNEIGVAACDEYLAKMDEYLANPKVPEAVRTAQKDAKEKYIASWKTAASTPQGKAGLETGCKAALDSMKSLPQF